jgi:nucleotide-binding universal stress UspA family protein
VPERDHDRDVTQEAACGRVDVMTTYVVGLDRTAPARAAIDWARAVGTAHDSIVVGHAPDDPVNPIYEGVAVPDPSAGDDAAAFLDRVVAEHADPRMTGRLLEGHAGTGLVELAEAAGPDATVVVGHGGSSKASLLVGSTAHYVTHHIDTPVVVVRGELRLPVRRVVVGVDGGHDVPDVPDDRSLAALHWAMRVPGIGRIEVSHADFVPGVAAGPLREPGLESDDAVRVDLELLQRAIELASDGTGNPPNGAEVVPVVSAGTGAFALIEASREADLVVVGSHARSGLVELILGSTSLEVLAHAHCPVAVIRSVGRRT